MEKHKPSDEMLEDLDNMLSKLNAMEILAKDEFQKGVIHILRALIQGQMHSVNEFSHMKKRWTSSYCNCLKFKIIQKAEPHFTDSPLTTKA